MSKNENSINVNPAHVSLLNDTLQSPSAHNVQPWKIKPLGDDAQYDLYYYQADNLPLDHHNKDAYLTMGAFVETMVLQAPNHGLVAKVSPELTKEGKNLYIARISIAASVGQEPHDKLSDWVGSRITNRNKYSKNVALTPDLEDALSELGNTLVDPEDLKSTVHEASSNAWADERYIADLEEWFHPQKEAVDGITPKAFNIDKASEVGLRFAFRHGPFKSKLMGKLLAAADVGYFTHSTKAAVLNAPDMQPSSLFEAGRRMLRSWVTITGHGYSYQPYSVAIDEAEPAAKVAEITGVDNPISLIRIGKAKQPPRGQSPRRPLDKVII